jgi:hypothetical protein
MDMRNEMSVLAILGLVLAGCAAEGTREADDSNASSVEMTQEALLAAQAAGYSLTTKNGEQVLCREDTQTGSRLNRTTTCLTAREWARVRNSSRQSLQDMTRGHKPPPDAGT